MGSTLQNHKTLSHILTVVLELECSIYVLNDYTLLIHKRTSSSYKVIRSAFFKHKNGHLLSTNLVPQHLHLVNPSGDTPKRVYHQTSTSAFKLLVYNPHLMYIFLVANWPDLRSTPALRAIGTFSVQALILTLIIKI